MVALDVVGCDVKYRIIVVYRPPYSDVHAQSTMTDILSCLEELTAVSYPTIIAGDFNLHNIDWSHLSGPNDMFCTSFIDFVNDAGLTQFVTAPTRGDHVLDILLSNDAYILSDCWVESPLGFNIIRSKSSDHNTVHFNIHCGAPSSTADCDDLFIGIMLMLISLHLTIIYRQLIGSLCWLIAMMLMYIGTTLCAL